MSDHTPSQAEGDRDDEQDTTPRPTPSQAEGDRGDENTPGEGDTPEGTATEESP
ncbi:hypothetical protein GCM10010234_00820 [Streptomyces hawaiiensis]|uniref:hypothetical protein n=1 Tax=Streptomyces hawaiiensis TaxID=67305 RepID=UPI0031DFA7D9